MSTRVVYASVQFDRSRIPGHAENPSYRKSSGSLSPLQRQSYPNTQQSQSYKNNFTTSYPVKSYQNMFPNNSRDPFSQMDSMMNSMFGGRDPFAHMNNMMNSMFDDPFFAGHPPPHMQVRHSTRFRTYTSFSQPVANGRLFRSGIITNLLFAYDVAAARCGATQKILLVHHAFPWRTLTLLENQSWGSIDML